MNDERCVMIVDDEPGVRGVLTSMLEREGYEVHTASDAREALGLFRSFEPDAVITDVRMPGKDGVALMHELREQQANVPVLVMTAFGTIDAAVNAMKAGATDYITKPFKRQRVVDALQRAIESRGNQSGDELPSETGPVVAEHTLQAGLDNCMTLRELGDLYIERILALAGGNKVRAARTLGINRRTLYRRGLRGPRGRGGGALPGRHLRQRGLHPQEAPRVRITFP